MSASDIEPRLSFALDLAERAAAEIMPRFRTTAVEFKADGTEVTAADREAERVMRELLADRYPDDAVLGEEFGETGSSGARYRWVLDPVDGTAWFTLGVPVFGTLIGLLEEGDPVLGVIHFPALDEMVWAARGLGCWHNIGGEAPVQARIEQRPRLRNAVVSLSSLKTSDAHPEGANHPYQLRTLVQRTGSLRFVGDCMQHALVAQGRVHAAIDPVMYPWDIAAIVPCVEEAGGVAATVSGQRENVVFGGSLITAASPALLNDIVEVLNQ